MRCSFVLLVAIFVGLAAARTVDVAKDKPHPASIRLAQLREIRQMFKDIARDGSDESETPEPEIPEPETPEPETPEPETEPELETTSQPEAVTTAQPEVETTPEPEVVTTTQPEVETTPQPEPETTPQPEVVTTAQPEVETTPEPEVVTTTQPEVETTPQPEPETTPQPEVVTTAQPEVETTPQPEPETTPQPDGLQLAEPCDEAVCRLPNCRCTSTNIPGGLAPRDTPQFVNINFRGVVFWETIDVIRRITYNRYNSNGCKSGATFFVNDQQSSDYHMLNELYNEQFEIGLHGIIYPGLASWQESTKESVSENIGDQRRQIAHFANIPSDAIRGVRAPHFNLLGNITFDVMQDYDLLYDNSWETRDPQLVNSLWPYTLDYASTQDCPAPPCPSASFPGRWVVPVLPWQNPYDLRYCSQINFCNYYGNTDEWFRFILWNFEKHYLTNRAPFTITLTEQFVNWQPEIQTAISRFLDLVSNLNDAFVVNTGDIVDWVKNPVPVNEYASRPCKVAEPAPCERIECEPYLVGVTTEADFVSCVECPRVYPSPGNPLGE